VAKYIDFHFNYLFHLFQGPPNRKFHNRIENGKKYIILFLGGFLGLIGSENSREVVGFSVSSQ